MELERCGFLELEVYLVFHNSLLFIFSIRNFCAPFVNFFQNFQKYIFIFFQFFLKRIRRLKYKQQGNVKVPISYQMQNLQCSIFKIATCEAFFTNTKILSFSKKTRKLCIMQKISTNHNIPLPNFPALFQISEL